MLGVKCRGEPAGDGAERLRGDRQNEVARSVRRPFETGGYLHRIGKANARQIRLVPPGAVKPIGELRTPAPEENRDASRSEQHGEGRPPGTGPDDRNRLHTLTSAGTMRSVAPPADGDEDGVTGESERLAQTILDVSLVREVEELGIIDEQDEMRRLHPHLLCKKDLQPPALA